jgi:hypothetical protein
MSLLMRAHLAANQQWLQNLQFDDVPIPQGLVLLCSNNRKQVWFLS